MKKFEQVRIKNLKQGDIFTHEIKIHNMEAGKEVKKQSELKVFYLRSL